MITIISIFDQYHNYIWMPVLHLPKKNKLKKSAMIVVASSLSLLAIVAGMLLYAKTIKDNLNLFFKIVACFIIVMGFLNLFLGSALIVMKEMYMHHQKMEMGSYEHHGKKMKKHKYMSHEGMDRYYSHKAKSKCCNEKAMMRKCCDMMERESSCSKDMMMKKDSIMMKKHMK